VDDDSMTCELIAKILSLTGYSPITLTDSQTIIEVIQSEKPAVILLDYYLGAVAGLDVLKVIKAHQETMSVPVIVTSGIDHRRQALDAGAEEFLLKPFDWDVLISKIDTLSGRVSSKTLEKKENNGLKNTTD